MPINIENNKEILCLVEAFTKDTLGDEKPKGNCFRLSYPLSLYLTNKGHVNSIRTGHYNYKVVNKHNPSHVWLTLDKDPEIIIDITGKQFDENMPLIYRGKPDEYEEGNITFKEFYDDWLRSFTTNGFFDYIQDPIDKADLSALLKINLKAAIILNNEKGIDITTSKKYFSAIYKILCFNWDTIQLFKNELPKDFNVLELKAKEWYKAAAE